MFPALLHFLLLLLMMMLMMMMMAAQDIGSSTDQQKDNTGMNFIFVFPENIAYYHPISPLNSIQVTALYDHTRVLINMHTYGTIDEILSAGQAKRYSLHASLELRKTNMSSTTLVISSTKNIAVNAVTFKHNSVQTALVTPTDKLGTKYLIPPLPDIPGATEGVSLDVTERRPFKLVIVSGDEPTTVSVIGENSKQISLQPRQVAQVLVKQEDKLKAVTADRPVAVLFSHACVIRIACTCGLLQSTLSPAKDQTTRFFIPPALASDTSGETFILVSKENSSSLVPFNPQSPLVETSGSAILYRPGLLLNLIPETDFASCFVVNRIQGMDTSIVIVIHKEFKGGVRLGHASLLSSAWEQLTGTDYVSTVVNLVHNKNVVWHTHAKMAVYFWGTRETALFGNPAPIISSVPDFRGCLVVPEVVLIGDAAVGWRESVKFCRDRGLELVSFSSSENVTHIYSEINRVKDASEDDVWIGLRRSSHSGQWYWLSGDTFVEVNWDDGEPGTIDDGQCAIMSLKNSQGFGWRDADCCKAARPVCYRRPRLLPL